MYFYSKQPTVSNKPSFPSKMTKEASEADAFAVGTHCQLMSCNRLDYLPWTCDRCKLKFCEDHRSPDSHLCAAAARAPIFPTQPARPNALKSATCHKKDCRTVLNTSTSPATRCVCEHLYCLKHRHPLDHACSGAPVEKSTFLSSPGSILTKESFLAKLKEWSSSRKSTGNKGKGNLLKGLIKTKSNQNNSSVVRRGLEIGQLRREAKGDSKIAEEKRIYVHGEGPPNLHTPLTSVAQVLGKPVFFSKEWSNGKVLDRLADTLGVSNQNNRTGEQDKRLQLFHIESGTLLEMDRKFGEFVKTGDTVVLARGW